MTIQQTELILYTSLAITTLAGCGWLASVVPTIWSFTVAAIANLNEQIHQLRLWLISNSQHTQSWASTTKSVVDGLISAGLLIDGEPCIIAGGCARKIAWKKVGPSVYAVSLKPKEAT